MAAPGSDRAAAVAPTLGRDLVVPTGAWLLVVLVGNRVQALAADGGRGFPDALWHLERYTGLGRVGGDSTLYLTVAEEGYRHPNGHEAGFPLYALAIRVLVALTGVHPVTAGVLITLVAGWAVAVLGWRFFGSLGLDGRPRRAALGVLLLWPGMWVLHGVVYSDALALAAVTGALLAAERARPLAAGLWGAAATATRLNALALVPMLVVRRLRPPWLAPTVALGGVGAYAVFLWRHVGDPFYFSWLQTHRYGHSPIWHPWAWLKVPVWRPVHGVEVAHEAASFALIVLVAASIPAVRRRIGLHTATFVAVVVATSWIGTYNVAPAERYLLPAVPVLAATWGPWLAARPVRGAALLGASGLACGAVVASFAGAFGLNW